MKREISPEKAERLIKKRLARDVSEAILDNTKMLNELDLGFGASEHIGFIHRRGRKR